MPDDLNTGHLEKYFCLITGLVVARWVAVLHACRAEKCKEESQRTKHVSGVFGARDGWMLPKRRAAINIASKKYQVRRQY